MPSGLKSAWGSDDSTKSAFPFLHGLALAEAGHSVQIFLLGEAVSGPVLTPPRGSGIEEQALGDSRRILAV